MPVSPSDAFQTFEDGAVLGHAPARLPANVADEPGTGENLDLVAARVLVEHPAGGLYRVGLATVDHNHAGRFESATDAA